MGRLRVAQQPPMGGGLTTPTHLSIVSSVIPLINRPTFFKQNLQEGERIHVRSFTSTMQDHTVNSKDARPITNSIKKQRFQHLLEQITCSKISITICKVVHMRDVKRGGQYQSHPPVQGGLYGCGQTGGEKVGRKVRVHGQHLLGSTGGHQNGAIQKAHVCDLRVADVGGLLNNVMGMDEIRTGYG